MRGSKLGWLVATGTIAAVLTVPSGASAANNNDNTLADNAIHTYCYTSGFTTDASVGAYAMAVLGNSTDMDDLFPIDPPFCAFNETDIWFSELNLAPGVRGTRDCWLEDPAGICTSSDIVLDYGEIDNGALDWEDRRHVAVHEVGHSVGLGHGNGGAMTLGPVPDASLQWRTFSAVDIANINSWY
jgi:hypothetical protein